jgi:hypothetical protein
MLLKNRRRVLGIAHGINLKPETNCSIVARCAIFAVTADHFASVIDGPHGGRLRSRRRDRNELWSVRLFTSDNRDCSRLGTGTTERRA